MASPEATNDFEEDLEKAFEEDFAAWDAEDAAEQTHIAELSLPLEEIPSVHESVSDPGPLHIAMKEARMNTRTPSALLCLPKEILLRILSMVPATGLISAAQTSSALSGLASEDQLWRRLYCSRWGKPRTVRANTAWKRIYLDADGEEWEAMRGRAGLGAADPGTSDGAGPSASACMSSSSSLANGSSSDDPALSLLGAFLDMLRAKRATAPDRRGVDDPAAVDADVAAQIAAWRRARGLAGGAAAPPAPRPDLSVRGRRSLTFSRVNPGSQPPLYGCDQSGWLHVCGEACGEGLVDGHSGDVVCPVSGQSTDRLVHECEEADEYGEGCHGGGGGEGEEEAAGLLGGGGFGAIFAAGYACDDERQLNRLLGYRAL